MKILLLSLAFLLSHQAGAYDYVIASQVIPIPDARQESLILEAPFQQVGRIEKWTDKEGIPVLVEICTGTLIDTDKIITAAHCITKSKTSQPGDWYSFKAGYQVGKFLASARITGVLASGFFPRDPSQMFFDDVPDYSARDWAVLSLDKNLGAQVGFIKLQNLDTEKLGNNLMVVGYPYEKHNGEKQILQRRCSVLGKVGDYHMHAPQYRLGALAYIPDVQKVPEASLSLFHNCNTSQGSSGGPLLVQDKKTQAWSLVGIHTSGPAAPESIDQPPGLVPASLFIESLKSQHKGAW
ncbi:MAG: trypsin-like serine protease [Bdellovibrio sp.]